MVIDSGNHLEWPPTEPEEMYKLERRIDTMLTELFDKEFEEAMWERILEQGPPQDDDVAWLKEHAALAGLAFGKKKIDSKQLERQLEAL